MCQNGQTYLTEKTSETSGRAGRKKLWQLDSAFHCSVIGTCLSLRELRELCRKLRITVHAPLTDYELHRSFVGIAAKPSYATRRLHKHLDRKYQRTIHLFARVRSDADLEALWKEAMHSGDLAGAYWALATHPSASGDLCNRIYGEVHMLSHLAGAAIRAEKQNHIRSKTLDRALIDFQSKTKAQISKKDNVIRQLREQLKETRAAKQELDDLRDRVAAMESTPTTLRLRKQVEDYAALLTAERVRAEQTEAHNKKLRGMLRLGDDQRQNLEHQLTQLSAERDAMEAVLEKLLSPDCTACEGREECINRLNLDGRCILYVGGRSRQCAHFRMLVERQNGRFIHHDGGLHDGRSRLGSVLPQADVVLCPLDCVSHDAAHRVKQFCKHHGKQLVFLPRSSLAAFTRGLNEAAA